MSDINIKSTTIEKGIDLAKEFLQKIVGPSLDELGLLWSDNIKIWRLRNQLKNLEKVKRLVEKQDIKIKNVNIKVLLSYLENVSLEEEEKIQDVWANLFTNYIDAEKNLTQTVYPNILSQISSDDIDILKYMDRNRDSINLDASVAKLSKKRITSSISNLERLGIIVEDIDFHRGDASMAGHHRRVDLGQIEIVRSRFGLYFLTLFGREFLEACKR